MCPPGEEGNNTGEEKTKSHRGNRDPGRQAGPPLKSHKDPPQSFSSKPNQSKGVLSILVVQRVKDKRNSAAARVEWNKSWVGQEGHSKGTGTRGECGC